MVDEDAKPAGQPSGGRIVVGFDGSQGAREALAWAVEEAKLRAATIHIVNAWVDPLGAPNEYASVFPIDDVRDEVQRMLQKEIDDVVGGADVVVEQETSYTSPALALVEAARGADLLVVGSRGRGGFAGLLLGSVSQQCAHHAPCPLVVVRAGR
jgi:nucleotide-binding universal stress UspA family protein